MYPAPPSLIVMSVNCPVIVAEITVPAAVVAVIVSPRVKVPLASVRTSSIIGIVPSFLSVTLDTKAVDSDEPPVIVRPLKER